MTWAKPRSRKERYEQYIASVSWQAKRMKVMARENAICERCGEPATQVHHKSYKRLFDEPLGDLEALCGKCHILHHGIVPKRKKKPPYGKNQAKCKSQRKSNAQRRKKRCKNSKKNKARTQVAQARPNAGAGISSPRRRRRRPAPGSSVVQGL